MKTRATVSFFFASLFCPAAHAQSAGPSFSSEPVSEESDRPPGDDPAIADREAPEASGSEEAPASRSEEDVTHDSSPPSEEEHSDESKARAAFRRGDRLYFEGDYAGAIASFEQAYAWSGRIEMLFNLANAHERKGNYSEASVALRGYIPHAPKADRPALERRLVRLEELKTLQQEEQVNAATRTVSARQLTEESAHPRPFPIHSTLGVGFLTLGGASLATGVGFAISTLATRKKLGDVCSEVDGSRLCPSEAAALIEQEKTRSIVADAAFIGGALFTTAGVYFVVRSARRPERVVKAGLAPGRLLVEGSF